MRKFFIKSLIFYCYVLFLRICSGSIQRKHRMFEKPIKTHPARLLVLSKLYLTQHPTNFLMVSERHIVNSKTTQENHSLNEEQIQQLKQETNVIADEQLRRASNKRRIANILREISALAAEAVQFSTPAEDVPGEGSEKSRLTKEQYQAIVNLQTAKVLEFEAEKLEQEAQRKKKFMEEAVLDSSGFPICNILKIGPLEFVSTSDEVRHRVDHTVIGQLTGYSFTIYQKKKPRVVYDVSSIYLPVFNVPDTGDSCWGFMYHGSNQIFCAANRESRNSWMNAVSEAWFCQNEGLQGSLPSIKSTEREVANHQSRKHIVHQTNNTKKPLIDINIGLTDQNIPNITVDGQPISSMENLEDSG